MDPAILELIDRSVTRVGTVFIDLASYRVPYGGEDTVVSTDHDNVRWMRPEELLKLKLAAPICPR